MTQVLRLVERDTPEEALEVLAGFEIQLCDYIDVHRTDAQAASLLGIVPGVDDLTALGPAAPLE